MTYAGREENNPRLRRRQNQSFPLLAVLTSSLPWRHLKTTNNCEIWNLSAFLFSVLHWHVKGFSSKRMALKVDVLQDREIYSLQARPCIFQPRNITGWGSEGVKRES